MATTLKVGHQSKENNLNQVIVTTHEIVEFVENNKTKVIDLGKKIAIQKTDLETLKNSRENIQNVISENVAHVENSQGMAKALNEYYVKFISEAHMIYDYALNSYRDVEFEEENLEKLNEIDKKNKEKYTVLSDMYNKQEEELLKKLEEETTNNRRSEEERKNYNIKLKQELSEIEKEILVFEKEEVALDKVTAQYKDDVCQLKEDLIKADMEISDLTKKLQIAENEKQKDIIFKNLEESNEQLKELENIMIDKTAEFQNRLNENEGLKNEITSLESLNNQAEKKIETLINQVLELEKKCGEYEHNCNAQIEMYIENLNKTELYLKSEKENNEKLATDEETLKINLKTVESDVEELKIAIHKLEPEPKQDAKNELEDKEQIAKKLILKYENLNDEYKRRLAEKRAKIEKDIVEIEIDNSSTESSIKLLEEEIKEIGKEMEEVNKKKLDLDIVLRELVKVTSIFKAVAPVKLQKRWDSDTTMEDEDTSYADNVMKKVQKMKK